MVYLAGVGFMKNIEKYKVRLKNMAENDLSCCVCSLIRKGQCYESCNTCKEKAIEWLCSEYKEAVLDETERNYLSQVLKPFKLYISTVCKYKCVYQITDRESIAIRFKNGTSWQFPTFKAGAMYKGMKIHKEYTLEELGL